MSNQCQNQKEKWKEQGRQEIIDIIDKHFEITKNFKLNKDEWIKLKLGLDEKTKEMGERK